MQTAIPAMCHDERYLRLTKPWYIYLIYY